MQPVRDSSWRLQRGNIQRELSRQQEEPESICVLYYDETEAKASTHPIFDDLIPVKSRIHDCSQYGERRDGQPRDEELLLTLHPSEHDHHVGEQEHGHAEEDQDQV